MPWRRDFPEHAVPKRIQNLVDSGFLEDATRPEDPAPSFIAKLLKGSWLRVWVEHPEMAERRAGPWRYRVEIAKDLDEEGRLLIEDNSVEFIWPTLISNLKILGVKSRWRLMGGGGEKPPADEYDFADIHAAVTYSGKVGDWYYFDVELTSPSGVSVIFRENQVSRNPQEAAMAIIRNVFTAYSDPSLTITKTVEQGGDRDRAIEMVRAGEVLGPEYLAPAYVKATEEFFGLTEEPPERGPLEWFPRGVE